MRQVALVLGNKAVAGVFVALFIGVLARWLVPSDADRIARALASRPVIAMPTIPHFVHRAAIDEIVAAATSGSKFILVEGGNRMGKTVAVRAAAARLSTLRTVLWTSCVSSSTVDTVLQRLFGLQRNTLVDYLFGLLRSTVGPPEEIEELVLARARSAPEPVLVVERAELLPLEELKRLLNFAKEMRDAGLGRFILVFSPSDKLAAVSAYGSMSRARVVQVLDLSPGEAAAFLAQFCPPDRTAQVLGLLGGHLPHLMEDVVADYCAGSLGANALEGFFAALVDAKLTEVEWQLGCSGCACAAICAVVNRTWTSSALAAARPLLLAQHIARSSLLHGRHTIDAPFVLGYIEQRCSCTSRAGPLCLPPGEAAAAQGPSARSPASAMQSESATTI